jgi:hypothetical protein
MTTSKRPELGELTVGQPVMVRRSPNDMRRRPPEERYIPAKVVKVARVWVELGRADDMPMLMTWRMRLDTQDEGTRYSGMNASFLTMDQHAWTETRDWARAVLRDHGIRLDQGSPWSGREAELADLLSSDGCLTRPHSSERVTFPRAVDTSQSGL